MTSSAKAVLLIALALVAAGASLDRAATNSKAADCTNECRERRHHKFCTGETPNGPCFQFELASCLFCQPGPPIFAVCLPSDPPLFTNCTATQEAISVIYYDECTEECECDAALDTVEASDLRMMRGMACSTRYRCLQ